MPISSQDIQQLRQETGVGMMDAKRALEAASGDMAKAIEDLRKAGVKVAAQKSGRTIKEGVVGTYVHANLKVGAMVSLGCETDFVARTEDFQNLAHDLALHVAAMNPQYLDPASVPAEVIEAEKDVYREQLKNEGKPEAMMDKIIDGKLQKFYSDVCLLNQLYVKDDSMTITQFVQAAVTKLGENIQILSFNRQSI